MNCSNGLSSGYESWKTNEFFLFPLNLFQVSLLTSPLRFLVDLAMSERGRYIRVYPASMSDEYIFVYWISNQLRLNCKNRIVHRENEQESQ